MSEPRQGFSVDPDAATLDAERPALMGLAYRMLGTVADAEDAVQETYARWFRMSRQQRDDVQNVGGWLMRTASRICLDLLGSARARREHYVGEWLPEPLPSSGLGAIGLSAASATADPLDRVALDESVSTAMLVVLESLTPAERVAFVLHDVFAMSFAEIAEIVGRTPDACRQLASSARRHIRERRAGAATREQHAATTRAFLEAAASGEFDRLLRVLDPSVVAISDGGGLVNAARRPVVGADRVARFLLGIIGRRGESMRTDVHETADGLVLTATEGGVVDSVTVLDVEGERIVGVRIMRNPEKLALWNRADAPH
ncbi:RNA polymerase sigma factor SigJ [Agromyces sp. NPDC058110]|uniref:RNA polymerase sigma factor SigJ n=1 Tax=Agromyces sp. NPDC058110 TaxID=3346345 RepID=UPI0036DBA090